MALRLGWKAGTEQFPPDALLEYAGRAEAAGFDTLDVSDHFHPWSEAGQASFTWTWLGAVAVKTQRIEIGTGLTCPILRYQPAVIAQAAATLDYMAPGRTYLGVGTGEALNEYSSVAQWPSYRERQARLAEAIQLIRQLWTGEAVTWRGTYYQTRRARLYTRSGSPIPIYVSSLVPGSAGFAGQHGDGLLTVGGKPLDVYRQMLSRFEAGARAQGRDPAQLRRMIELNVAYTDDVARAIEDQRRYWAGAYVPALYNQNIYTPKMSEQNGAVVGPDTIRQRACLSPDPDEHVRFAQQFIELGFDCLIFHSAEPDQAGFIERYGRDVLPRLRAANTQRAA